MEEYSINITDGCTNDIIRIAEYISDNFLDEDLANKTALNIYSHINMLSYLASAFGYCENDKLAKAGIRKYNIKKYTIYYEIVDNNKVNVLRVKHYLQDENKFWGLNE